MSFSRDWEERYRENTHMAVWPWSDLVSLVHRHCRIGPGARVLELGCGAGANVPFFRALRADYYGIDGSATIVKYLQERFPDMRERFEVADFCIQIPFRLEFDLIVDRAAVTHNDSRAIEAALDNAWHAMRPGGCYVGVDWFSTSFSEFHRGEPGTDGYTRRNYRDGPFAGTGRVHFSDEAHLRALLSRFEIVLLEEKQVRTVQPERSGTFGAWNLVARKPHG